MAIFNRVFLSLKRKFNFSVEDDISKYVFYKIVDTDCECGYILQCINTKSHFNVSISDLVFDLDLLYRLHPVQACYIGLQYAFYIKKHEQTSKITTYKKNNSSVFEYGVLKIQYQIRNGDICYINTTTLDEFIMSPREIAYEENLIDKFHAEHAFYIGFQAGLEINKMEEQPNLEKPTNVLYLA